MKTIQNLVTAIAFCAFALSASAQCNSTFSYLSNGSNYYTFTANQVEQQGYTYNYTWNLSTGDVYYTPTAVESFYNGPGNYQACLTVSIQNSLGVNICTDSTCLAIIVPPVIQCFPNLYFSVLQDTTTTQFSFTNNLTDYTNVAISWNFGDGTQLAGIAAPTHNFPGYGEYTVCFYATDTISHCMDSTQLHFNQRHYVY
jgi:hypothetical protein